MSTILTVDTHYAKICMAGSIDVAKHICRIYCMEKKLCVTVTPTEYIYTGGSEKGFFVELINYPRFASNPDLITNQASELATILRKELCQWSSLIMTPKETIWTSDREQ